MEGLKRCFEELEDPRSGNAARHDLLEMLILLRHKRRRVDADCRGAWQHGHRSSVLARATVRRRLRVAIEFGMWRSGRIGGTSGVGNRRERQVSGASWRDLVLRGESTPARRSGSRRWRCTAWRDDESRATLV